MEPHTVAEPLRVIHGPTIARSCRNRWPLTTVSLTVADHVTLLEHIVQQTEPR